MHLVLGRSSDEQRKTIQNESTVDTGVDTRTLASVKLTPSRLPFEMVEVVVKQVDRQSKRSCTLVNRTWASVARRELWKYFSLHESRRIRTFFDLIQSQKRTQEDRSASLGLPKMTAFISDLNLTLYPSDVDVACKVLGHMGSALKTLSLFARGDSGPEDLCQIAAVCPRSVKSLEIYMSSGNGSKILAKDGPEFQKLQQSFRRIHRVQWSGGPNVNLVLASLHEGLRFFGFSGVTIFSQDDLIKVIYHLPRTLVTFDAAGIWGKLGGRDLVLLGSTCPNLKVFQCPMNQPFITNEALEKFLSIVGPTLKFLEVKAFCSQDIQVVARHCRSIKHLQVVFRGGESDAPDFEDLLRNVGPTILSLSFRMNPLASVAARHLVPTIINYDYDDTTIGERDVQELFRQCKKLVGTTGPGIENGREVVQVLIRMMSSGSMSLYGLIYTRTLQMRFFKLANPCNFYSILAFPEKARENLTIRQK
ncbi:hypothetical protein HK102_000835 [Quaeritorhiza haematococci]|nr:hypothetical protein HK102_000835 [Quaeritorhiza haematococci]